MCGCVLFSDLDIKPFVLCQRGPKHFVAMHRVIMSEKYRGQLFKTTLLVKVLLKFQTLISQKCQYFLLKICEKLLHCKSFSHFFQQKISVYLVIKS